MINKIKNMKKLLPIIIVSLFLLSCVYASADNININGADFKIPSQYQGGEFDDDSYWIIHKMVKLLSMWQLG